MSRAIEAAFDQARKAAGDMDIPIVGGADIIRQCLDGGLVQEARLNLIPILLGSGTRMFEGVDTSNLHFAIAGVTEADGVVHLRFREG
jgi:dihydrofolate reductase